MLVKNVYALPFLAVVKEHYEKTYDVKSKWTEKVLAEILYFGVVSFFLILFSHALSNPVLAEILAFVATAAILFVFMSDFYLNKASKGLGDVFVLAGMGTTMGIVTLLNPKLVSSFMEFLMSPLTLIVILLIIILTILIQRGMILRHFAYQLLFLQVMIVIIL